MSIRPFQIAVLDEALEDLHRRLRGVRWPVTMPGTAWSEGTDLDFLQRLVSRWRDTFDWRASETRLNQLPHFMADVEGEPIHFIHQRGVGPDPMPLVLTHGWPGSFLEMEAVIPMLTDPARFGGDPRDAFHVVVPSLPGYAFSPAPQSPGMGPLAIAHRWASLMRSLGYERFVAQGGDWGASVSMWLADQYPERVAGLHLNFIPVTYQPVIDDTQPPLTAEENAYQRNFAEWAEREGAYARIQRTKPQTLAFALADSPVGLAAWIAEKFVGWSDCDGELERAIALDTLLENISMYWFTGSIGSSFRLYLESHRRPLRFAAGHRVVPPVGVAHFAGELPMPPRSYVQRVFDVRRWTRHPHGGHFAALEVPEAFAADLRKFSSDFDIRKR